MTIVNLTPHAVNIVFDGEIRQIQPSGKIARVTATQTSAGSFDGIPLIATEFGDVIDLPAPQNGIALIVSALVRTAVPNREDVMSPGDLVRDEAGNVIGCKGLITNKVLVNA